MNANRRMIKIEMNTESLMDAGNPDPNHPQVEVWRVLIRANHADYMITMLPPAEIQDREGKAIELILLGKKNSQDTGIMGKSDSPR